MNYRAKEGMVKTGIRKGFVFLACIILFVFGIRDGWPVSNPFFVMLENANGLSTVIEELSQDCFVIESIPDMLCEHAGTVNTQGCEVCPICFIQSNSENYCVVTRMSRMVLKGRVKSLTTVIYTDKYSNQTGIWSSLKSQEKRLIFNAGSIIHYLQDTDGKK